MTRFYAIAVGELAPDFVSRRIQDFLTEKHGVPVDWSHCGLLVEGHPDPDMDGVWDSTGRGFERCTLEEALDHGEAVLRRKILLPVRNEWEAAGWLKGNRGRWYARAQYVLYFLPPWGRRLLGRVLPGFVKKLFANGRALQVCSESLHYFIYDNVLGGPELLQQFGSGDVTDPYQAIVACESISGASPEII